MKWLVALLLIVPGEKRTPQDTSLGMEVVHEINLARTQPSRYADILEDQLPLYNGLVLRRPGQPGIATREGAAAVREAIRMMRAQQPLEPLTWSAGLAFAAADLVRSQGPAGGVGHTAPDGSTPRSRIERHGVWGGRMSENIDYGHDVPREVVIAFLVDDNIADRGHRKNLLDPAIRFAGAACGPHQRYRVMCAIDHAGDFTARR